MAVDWQLGQLTETALSAATQTNQFINLFVFASPWCGPETCLQDVYTLTFEENAVKITAENNSPWQFAGQEPILAVLE